MRTSRHGRLCGWLAVVRIAACYDLRPFRPTFSRPTHAEISVLFSPSRGSRPQCRRPRALRSQCARRRVALPGFAWHGRCLLRLRPGCASLRPSGRCHAEKLPPVASCRAKAWPQWKRAIGRRPKHLLQQAVEASPKMPMPHRYLAEALWHRGAADDGNGANGRGGPTRSDRRRAGRAGGRNVAGRRRIATRRSPHAERAIRLDPKLASGLGASRPSVLGGMNQPRPCDGRFAACAGAFAPRCRACCWT